VGTGTASRTLKTESQSRTRPWKSTASARVGFVFDGKPDSDGLVLAGVDFDKVIAEGKITSLAQERIIRIGSYFERSVSGCYSACKIDPLSRGIGVQN
jgi:hypothetical protein